MYQTDRLIYNLVGISVFHDIEKIKKKNAFEYVPAHLNWKCVKNVLNVYFACLFDYSAANLSY